MNKVSIIRSGTPARRHSCLQAGMRICILLVPVIVLLLAPGPLVAQSDAFAGPWIDIGKNKYIIAVAGDQLSSRPPDVGRVPRRYQGEVTGPEPPRAPGISRAATRSSQDYNIEMIVSADGREMTVTGTRIQYGLRISVSPLRPWDWKAEAKTETGPILTCTYQLGHELPLLATDSKPVALSASAVRLNDAYR